MITPNHTIRNLPITITMLEDMKAGGFSEVEKFLGRSLSDSEKAHLLDDSDKAITYEPEICQGDMT